METIEILSVYEVRERTLNEVILILEREAKNYRRKANLQHEERIKKQNMLKQ